MHSPTSASALGPVLADFEGEPGAELEVALADDVGCGEQEVDAGLDRGFGPGEKGFAGGFDGALGVCGGGGVVRADDFCGVGWVVRGEGLGEGHVMAADDVRVRLAELAADEVERGEVAAGVFGV